MRRSEGFLPFNLRLSCHFYKERMMTVKELIAELEKQDPEAKVLLEDGEFVGWYDVESIDRGEVVMLLTQY